VTTRARHFLGVAGLFTLAGCYPSGLLPEAAIEGARCASDVLDGDTRFDATNNDAIVVVGVSRIYGMRFVSGVDDGVSWHDEFRESQGGAKADEGFVVARLKARRGKHRYSIARVSLEPEGHDCYEFPSSSTLLVFDAPAGQVTYLGALTVQYGSQGLANTASLRADPSITKEQASAYLARRFPQITRELSTGRMEWAYKSGPN
jgi:hypothetical protein